MGIIIVNGTTPVKAQRPLSGRGSDESIANEPPKKCHQPSKSGPAPRVSTSPAFLTSRGAGVEDSGPSRLPMRPARESQAEKPLPSEPSSPVANDEPTSRPSDGRKRTGTGPQTQLGSPRCKNSDRYAWSCEAPEASFLDCPCQRCSDMSRTVFVARLRVGEDGITNNDVCVSLTEYFSRWGHVETCHVRRSNGPTTGSFAFVRYTSEASAVNAVAAAKGLPLKGRPLVGAKVNHPHFSKHFRNVPWEPRIRSSGSSNSPPWGNARARNFDHRQQRQQIGSPPRRPAQSAAQATRWSPPTAASTVKTSPHRDGSWAGQQPQGSPPSLPPPPRLYGPLPPAHAIPHPQHGWHEMPMPVHMPPGPLAFYPYPPPPPMYHPHGPEQQDGVHGFPPLPPPPQQFVSPLPSPHEPNFHDQPHGPDFQDHRHGSQGSYGQSWSPTPPSCPVPATCPELEPVFNNEDSMQTKPPSDDEVSEGDVLTPTGSSTASAHSSAGSMSIRVRLPGMPSDSEPEECPVATPGRSTLRTDSPVRQITFGDIHTPVIDASTVTEEPVVLIEDHNRVGEGSPVRRITFGDFVPPEMHTASAAEENEITPTPHHATTDKDRAGQEPASLVSAEHGHGHNTFQWQLDPSSAQRNCGDIRLEPDFSGTVIRRPIRRQRVPWGEDEEGFSGSWDPNHGAYPATHGGDEMRHPSHFAPPPMPNGMSSGMHNGVHSGMYHPFNGAPYHPFSEPYWHGPHQAHPHPANKPYQHHWNGPYQAPPSGFQGSPPNPSGTHGSPPSQVGFHGSPPNPPGFQTSPPKPPPSQQNAEPGAPKAKPKKKKAKNKKNQSGTNSQATSRSATPLPQAANGHTAPPNTVPGFTTSGNAPRTKHKASTRPSTPVPPNTSTKGVENSGNAINQPPSTGEAGKPFKGKNRAPTRPTTPVPPKTGTENVTINHPPPKQSQDPGTGAETTIKPPKRKQHKPSSTRPTTPLPPKNENTSSVEENNINPTTQAQSSSTAANTATGADEPAKPPKNKRKPSTRPPTPIPPPSINGDNNNTAPGPEQQQAEKTDRGKDKNNKSEKPSEGVAKDETYGQGENGGDKDGLKTGQNGNGGGGFRAGAGGSLRVARHRPWGKGARRVHVREFFEGG